MENKQTNKTPLAMGMTLDPQLNLTVSLGGCSRLISIFVTMVFSLGEWPLQVVQALGTLRALSEPLTYEL